MQLQRILVPAGCLLLLGVAWRSYGWAGVAVAGGALVMWLLLHFTRLMTILKRAANRPIGHVGSAVMLNAKLKAGVTLMHVIALTRSLGEQRSPKDEQPERFRWTDGGGSHVTCEFRGGKLVSWALERPQPEPDQPPGEPPSAP